MNKIKGLIIKDILQLKTYCKSLVLFLVIGLVSAMSYDGAGEITTLITIYIPLGVSLIAFGAFGLDETYKSDKYILSMPFSRKEIVLEKYILILGSVILGAMLGAVCSVILSFFIAKEFPQIIDLINAIFGAILGIGLIQNLQIPLVFKFGQQKTRIYLYIFIFVLAIGVSFFASFTDLSILNTIKFLKENHILSIGFQTIFILVMTFISYKISYGIYSKKEF